MGTAKPTGKITGHGAIKHGQFVFGRGKKDERFEMSGCGAGCGCVGIPDMDTAIERAAEALLIAASLLRNGDDKLIGWKMAPKDALEAVKFALLLDLGKEISDGGGPESWNNEVKSVMKRIIG